MEIRSIRTGAKPASVDVERVYRSIAAYLGLRVRRTGPPRCHYTGRTIHILRDSDPDSIARNVSHEIGHYIVAPPEYRHVPNWGWEFSYAYWDTGADGVRQQSNEEEGAAAYVGAIVRRRFEPRGWWASQMDDWREMDLTWTDARKVRRFLVRAPDGKLVPKLLAPLYGNLGSVGRSG